jgi:cytochrome c-type biogenesis protein CcmF
VAAVGRCALLLALAAAVWAAAGSILGVRRPALADSARRSALAALGGVLTAAAALLIALLRQDFAVRYVAGTTDRTLPVHLRLLALWSGDAGSMLLWTLILAGFTAVAAVRLRHRPPVPALVAAVLAFYLLVTVVADPFARSAVPPADGSGMQPLLRSNLLMAIHPPLLYAGLIGFTVPFAMAMTLPVDRWTVAARGWLLTSWCLLTAGLALGALWSYTVLGWGGYWAWDPVENAAVMPWLTATALLHSARLQERRGVAVVGNLALMAGTFALTVLAVFLTRGNVLVSVHAFAGSLVGPLYLGFLVLVVVAGAVRIASRRPPPAAEPPVGAVATRETALLGNNVVLVALTVTVLAGTLYPLLVRAVTGRAATIGEAFYRTAATPMLVAVLVLAGIGPLLRWRYDTVDALARRAAPAALVSLVVTGLALLARPDPLVAAAIAAATFTAAANLTELLRPGRRDRRWPVAHVGFAMVALGVAVSAGYSVEAEATLSPGQRARLGGYDLAYDRLDGSSARLAAHITVSRGGHRVAELGPALAAYPGAAAPVGLPAVHRTPVEDVYLALLAVEQPAGRITVHGYVKPGMSLLWAGCAVAVAGGAVALLPVRRRTRAGVGV